MTRRNLLRSAASAMAAGALTAQEAQHVHQHAAAAANKSGVYKPRLFNAHEFRTIAHLADMIIPPEGNAPGGAGAGAPQFIDLLASNNDLLREVWLGGLAWLDAAMTQQCGRRFIDAPHEERFKLLDKIAYRRNDGPEYGPGIRFFDWARRMVVDAWTTSPAGTKALGFAGNKGMQVFQVPVEALDYAWKRSPFAGEPRG
jgi:hypothetical protein